MREILFAALAASVPLVKAHIAMYTDAMLAFNGTAEMFSYDNRPMAPLQQYTFDQWWMHGHLKYEPEPGKFFELPAGNNAVAELACNKGATSYWKTSEGTTDIRTGDDYPCPGYPLSQFHGIDDLKGCALSIAYTSDFGSVKPEDLAIFSVNHQCVWKTHTPFPVPAEMPPCPEGGCICAWHWIHSVDSGSAQMYMNGFRCKVTGSTSNTPIGKPQVPKRCTNDPSQCNQGPQQPLYWFQQEGNNMFNDQYDPPYYLDEWGFFDGAQKGLFNSDGTVTNTTNASPSSSVVPSSSTPTNTPSSTPAGNTPSSTPAENSPSSTPAGSSPSSTPPGVYDYVGSSSSIPYSSPSSPAPSPTNNGEKSDPTTNTLSSNQPQPSNKTCKSRNKKRHNVVGRHSKHRRHH